MKFSGVGCSDIGQRRERNEDHLLFDNELGLYIVADGIGGYSAGDVAAQLAVQAAATYIDDHCDLIAAVRRGARADSELSSLAVKAVTHASRQVFETSRRSRKLAGMGCTITLLLLGRSAVAMAHVGDSRLYLSRDSRVRQLSKDHNIANELLDLGIIASDQVGQIRCGQVLTRSIGRRRDVSVEELLVEAHDGDHFILCTDGLSNYLARPEELYMLLSLGRFESSARRMIDFANTCGGQDNITAIVVRIDSVEPLGAPIDVAAPARPLRICDSGNIAADQGVAV